MDQPSNDVPEPGKGQRLGFLAGEIDVPNDFDRMGEAEIAGAFGIGSTASLQEITIKRGLGRSDFRVDPHLLRRGLVENDYTEVPITSGHVMATVHLPPLHKDPFDRVLVARAQTEGALLLTSDEVVARYPGPVRKV